MSYTHRFITRFAVSCVFLAAGSVAAQTSENEQSSSKVLEAFGQTLNFPNPSGYCNLGSSAAEQAQEQAFQRYFQGIYRQTRQLLHISAPCSELEELVAGKRTQLDHWLQVNIPQQPSAAENRTAFINQTVSQMQRITANASWQHDAANSAVVESLQLEFAGHDANAAYMRALYTQEKGAQVRSFGAATWVHSVPLTISISRRDTATSDLEALPTQVKAVVEQLIATDAD